MAPSTFLALGGGAWHAWVRVCDDPGCDCGDAIVLATREGRALLEPFVALVEAAWPGGAPHRRAIGLSGGAVVAFALQVESGRPYRLGEWHGGEDDGGDSWDDRADEVAAALDGEILDDLFARWRAVPGRPDPTLSPAAFAATEQGRTWSPGVMIRWRAAHPEARRDAYDVGDDWMIVEEVHCLNPGCGCGNAQVLVWPTAEADPVHLLVNHAVGTVEVSAEHAALWARYTARHPDWRARLRAQAAALAPVGQALLEAHRRRSSATSHARPLPSAAPAPARRAVGRNDACPCGSGRKYKRCCGAPGAVPRIPLGTRERRS